MQSNNGSDCRLIRSSLFDTIEVTMLMEDAEA